MSDLEHKLRPITADEWPRFIRSMLTTFGEEPDFSLTDLRAAG